MPLQLPLTAPPPPPPLTPRSTAHPRSAAMAAGSADLPGLVQSLRSGRKTAQVQAAHALLALMAGDAGPPVQHAIAEAGALPALVPLLRSSSEAVQTAATNALRELTRRQSGICQAFMAAGGLPPLLDCMVGSGSEQLQTAAVAMAGDLMNWLGSSGGAAVRQAMASSPTALSTCFRLLDSRHPRAQNAGATVRKPRQPADVACACLV